MFWEDNFDCLAILVLEFDCFGMCVLTFGSRHFHFLQYGWTALHLAAEKGHMDVATVLLDRGANLEAQDKVCLN